MFAYILASQARTQAQQSSASLEDALCCLHCLIDVPNQRVPRSHSQACIDCPCGIHLVQLVHRDVPVRQIGHAIHKFGIYLVSENA
jgi:hypothetical protein